MEDSLKKLEASEVKYSTELDNALKQYVELKEQAKELDPIELYKVRQSIRPDHERDAAHQVQDAYGDKYNMLQMYDSKREISNLLGEASKERSIREKLRAMQREQKQQTTKNTNVTNEKDNI